MTKEQVKASESIKIIDDVDEGIGYIAKVAGMETHLGYFFINGKLVRTGYTFKENHTNWNNYIDDYDMVKEILIKKYGLPNMDEQWWRNDRYKDEPQNWGLAIGTGHLVYLSVWETETTKIQFVLSGDNFEVHLAVKYESKKFKNLIEQNEQRHSSDDF